MNINPLKSSKKFNNRDLTDFPGLRFYYSKPKSWISFTFTVMLFLFVLYLFFNLLSEKEELFHIFIVLILLIYIVIQGFGFLSKILLKNPIFILDKTRIYYLKTDQWYDLEDHTFTNSIEGSHNYYLTLYVTDSNGKRVIVEKNWLLSDEDRLFSSIRYYKNQYPR